VSLNEREREREREKERERERARERERERELLHTDSFERWGSLIEAPFAPPSPSLSLATFHGASVWNYP
jgi:hypothetical protein